MTALLLPFAARRTDGLLMAPEEVERGLACNCLCPGCGHAVMAKQGTEKVWHFAHHRSPTCSTGYEKSVHELAKQLLRERRELLLPSLIAVASAPDAYRRTLEEREVVVERRSVHLDECKTAVKLDHVVADVLGRLHGHQVLVEVTVFHRLTPDKAARLASTGIASLEIDLSRFKTQQATRPLVEAALFEDAHNRRWLFHPKRTAAENLARERLQLRLAKVHDEFVAAAAQRPAPFRGGSPVRHVGAMYQAPGQRVMPSATTGPVRWRVVFPSDGDIRRAQVALSKRTGKPLMQVVKVTFQATSLRHLEGYTPDTLAAKWADELGVSSGEVLRYFGDAFYTI